MTFRVQKKPCETCIYKKSCALDIKKLEADVADKHMPGLFEKHRQCHHTDKKNAACCRGFWNRHKDKFPAGQIAQRLNMVEFVEVDTL